MGRAYSVPEATPRFLGGYEITRVSDPDDEFARTEWLSYAEDGGLEWRDSPSAPVQGSVTDLSMVVAGYVAGYNDAADRSTVYPLGS
jgi:hypothetical protein